MFASFWARLEQTRYRSPPHHDLQIYFLPSTPQVSNFREPAGRSPHLSPPGQAFSFLLPLRKGSHLPFGERMAATSSYLLSKCGIHELHASLNPPKLHACCLSQTLETLKNNLSGSRVRVLAPRTVWDVKAKNVAICSFSVPLRHPPQKVRRSD